MLYPTMLIPPKINYILHMLGYWLLANIIMFFFRGIFIAFFGSASTSVTMIGWALSTLIGSLTLWVYDELTHFRRLSIVISGNHVTVPFGWADANVLFCGRVDKARTISHNASPSPLNRLSYTFWLTDGKKIEISKLLWSPEQIKLIIEKMDC